MMSIDLSQFTDRILIRLAPDQSAGQHVFTWMGSWPPPTELNLAIENRTDHYKLIDPGMYPEIDWERFSREHDCEVLRFYLHRASEQPQAAAPSEHWFRGAEYLPKVGS
jgi:hypothetical protein